jgi:hypothetical protein
MIAIIMALLFALLSIMTFVLESVTAMQCINTFALQSVSIFKTFVLDFNHEFSMCIKVILFSLLSHKPKPTVKMIVALLFALLSIMTFVLESMSVTTMQCINTFALQSISIFKTFVLDFNHEFSMCIFDHADNVTTIQCINTFVFKLMSILKTFVLEWISVHADNVMMQCIKTFVLELMSILKTFVLEWISVFSHADNVTIQCIKTFVMCITSLELFKFFMLSVPAMRCKVLISKARISKALLGRKVLEETLKLVAEIDKACFMSDTGNKETLVDEIKVKLEVFLQSDGMDDNTKAAVELQFMNYVKVVYCLKKKHGYFIFGSKWFEG